MLSQCLAIGGGLGHIEGKGSTATNFITAILYYLSHLVSENNSHAIAQLTVTIKELDEILTALHASG